jgi:beta-galactosidase
VLGETRISTAGAPAGIELSSDRVTFEADGEDMVFVTARIVDAEGNLCPRAALSVTFGIDGPARVAAVCNGDATSVESFKADRIKAFNGACVAYVQSVAGETGDVTLHATSDGLADGTIVMSCA